MSTPLNISQFVFPTQDFLKHWHGWWGPRVQYVIDNCAEHEENKWFLSALEVFNHEHSDDFVYRLGEAFFATDPTDEECASYDLIFDRLLMVALELKLNGWDVEDSDESESSVIFRFDRKKSRRIRNWREIRKKRKARRYAEYLEQKAEINFLNRCGAACEFFDQIAAMSEKAQAKFDRDIDDAYDWWENILQSGLTKAKRAERDAQQRKAAEERKKEARKRVPKREREQKIKQERDKRTPVFQSGKAVPIAIGLGAGLLFRKVFSFLSKAEGAADGFHTLAEQLKKIAASLKEQLGNAIWHIPLVLTVFYAVKHFECAGPLAVGLLIAALAKLVGPTIWAVVSNFFPDGNVRSQAGLASVFDVAPKLLSTLFAFSVLRNKRPGAAAEFCKRLSMLERLTGGWEAFLKWMLRALESLINYVRRLFGKERVQLFRDANRPTYEWAKKIDDVCMAEATGDSVTADRLDLMVELVQQGFAYKEIYRGTTLAKYVDDYVIKIVNALMPYQGSLNARNNFRFEPATLMLYGDPGIGKTLMAMHLCSTVMLESGLIDGEVTFDNVVKQVWQKGSSEFYNGYTGQTCMVIDDAFQSRSNAADKDNDYMSLIRMVSSWSFPLNFADLASKGKIYFNSKFIFGTTNLKSIDSEARIVIQNPDAVARRLTFPYAMRVAKDYATPTGRLDYDKFLVEVAKCASEEKPIDRFPWYIWEAARHDFLTGETSNFWSSMKYVVEKVSENLRTRTASHANSKASLASFIDGYRKGEFKVDAHAGREVPRQGPDDFVDYSVDRRDYPATSDASFRAIMTVLEGGSYYDILGVSPEASQQEIKDAYLRLAKLLHPDKCAGHPSARHCMTILNGMYDRLSTEREHRRKMSSELEDNISLQEKLSTYVRAALGCAYIALYGFLVFKALKAITGLLWGLISDLFGGVKKAGEAVFNKKPKEKKTDFQSNRPVFTPRKVGVKDPVFQSVDTAISGNVYANTYKMYVECNGGSAYIFGQVMFLVHNLAVQPEHFTEQLKSMLADGTASETSKVTLRSAANAEHSVTFSVSHYLGLKRHVQKNRDIEFIDFGEVRSHRKIISSFMKESDLKSLPGYLFRLDVCDVDQNKRIKDVNNRKSFIMPVTGGKDLQVGSKMIERYVTYRSPTDTGDCGAPLNILDPSCFSGRSCVGIHVAGNRQHQVGYSAILTQDMIFEAVKELNIIVDNFTEDLEQRCKITLHAGNELPFEKKGSFMAIGTVPKPVVICPKTSLYKTRLYDQFGHYDYYPARMSPVQIDGKTVFPMENAVANYSTPLYIYEQPWLKQAMHTALIPLSGLIRDMPKRLYTFDEAILGIPTEKFRSIPRGTAAGFPYVYDVRNGKKEFFGEEDNYDLTLPLAVELRERVDHVIDQASKNVRLSHVFVDFLKDELRPAAKVKAVATRLISSAPLDYTVAWRMYFGAFSSAVMRTNTRSGMAPGICTFTDWDILVQMLKKKGNKCFDGDFKAFDSSEQPTIHKLILDFINDWYNDGEENARIRRVLWLDLVHSRHIGGLGADQRHIYQWCKSLPSGHPFTTIVNSIYSLFLLVATYYAITGEHTTFWQHVSSVTYGDDNASNVSDEKAEVYNQVTVSEVMPQQFPGIVYTPGNKTGEFVPFTVLEELTFLKRSFARRDGHWVCPLQLESFLYTAYWCKNKKLEETITIDVLENALEELSMHDKEVWDLYAPQIRDVLEERYHVTRAPVEQNQYQQLIASRTDSWY